MRELGSPQPTADQAAADAPAKALSERWSTQLGGPILGTPAIADEQLYVVCESGELVAFDGKDGRRRWSYWSSADAQPQGAAGFQSTPCVSPDTVYAGDEEGRLHAIDRATGKRRWQFVASDMVRGATVVGDLVLFGSYDHNVYAVKAKDGALLWKYETNSHVNATPRVVGDEVLVAGCDGTLHILELATGKLLRNYPLGEHLTSQPAVSGDIAYVTSYSGEVWAVNFKNGQPLWKYSLSNPKASILSSAVVTERLVLFGTLDHRLYAVDRATGKTTWSFNTRAKVLGSPLVVDERVLVVNEDGNLHELSLQTGELRSAVSLGQPVRATPVASRGLVVVCGEGAAGKVVCFTDPPRTEEVVAPTGTGPVEGKLPSRPRVGRSDAFRSYPAFPTQLGLRAKPAPSHSETRHNWG